jgi:hypothetical protein
MRGNAEKSRSEVLSALLSTTGAEGWAAKLEMAADPLFEHIKDRAIALAEERAAEEADNAALTEAEFAILDKTGESPPTTLEAMFALMWDRLDDIDDLLFQDISPRELWASITDERVMRRELARAARGREPELYHRPGSRDCGREGNRYPIQIGRLQAARNHRTQTWRRALWDRPFQYDPRSVADEIYGGG